MELYDLGRPDAPVIFSFRLGYGMIAEAAIQENWEMGSCIHDLFRPGCLNAGFMRFDTAKADQSGTAHVLENLLDNFA